MTKTGGKRTGEKFGGGQRGGSDCAGDVSNSVNGCNIMPCFLVSPIEKDWKGIRLRRYAKVVFWWKAAT